MNEINLTKEQLLAFVKKLKKLKPAPEQAIQMLEDYANSLPNGESTGDIKDVFKQLKVLDIYLKLSKPASPEDQAVNQDADKEEDKGSPDGKGKEKRNVDIKGVRFIPKEELKQLEKDAEEKLKEKLKKQEEALRQMSKILTGGASGGGPADLTNIRCEEPIISTISGAFSGFLPRFLYHASGLSASSKLKKQLKDLDMNPKLRSKNAGFIKRVLKRVGLKKAGGAAFLLGSLAIIADPDLVNVPGKIISKPGEEAKKLSEIIDTFTSWSNGITNPIDANYVLDPCFLASFAVGLTGLSFVRVMTGKTFKAFETQRFLKQLDSRTFKSGDDFLKHLSQMGESGKEYVKLLESTGFAIKKQREKVLEIIDLLDYELQGPALDMLKGVKPKGNINAKVQEAIIPSLTIIKSLKQEQDEAFKRLLIDQKRLVTDSLAASTDFFKVFDAIPGARITAEQVAYLKKAITEAGDDFEKSFKALDESREAFIKSLDEIENFGPDTRKTFMSIESKLDKTLFTNESFDLSPEMIERAKLTRSEKKFLDGLPDEVRDSMTDLYKRKMDALDKIDVYEGAVASARSFEDVGDSLDPIGKAWNDSNDLLTKEVSKSNLKNTAIGNKFFKTVAGLEVLGAVIAPIASFALYQNATGNLEKQLSRENINEIHNFLKTPTPEKAKSLEKAVASIYRQLAKKVDENPNITYEEVMGIDLEQAVEDKASIDVTGFEGTDKSIAIVLAFEYLKKLPAKDELSKIKPTDVADRRKIGSMAYLLDQDDPIMTEEEYTDLFKSSYGRVKEVLERFAGKENIELKDPTPDTTGQEGEKPTAAEEPPAKRVYDEEGERGLAKMLIIETVGLQDKYSPKPILAVALNRHKSRPNVKIDRIVGPGITPSYLQWNNGSKYENAWNNTAAQNPRFNDALDLVKEVTKSQASIDSFIASQGSPTHFIHPNGMEPDPTKTKYEFIKKEVLRKKIPGFGDEFPRAEYAWPDIVMPGRKNGRVWSPSGEQTVFSNYPWSVGANVLKADQKSNADFRKREYKLNDLRKLVTEVMNINEQDVQKTLDKLKDDPHSIHRKSPGDAEGNVSHFEKHVLKISDLETMGINPYYKKVATQAFAGSQLGDVCLVLYGAMQGKPSLDTEKPAILDRDTAESFYYFLDDWPTYLGPITLKGKTATWDSVHGGSDRKDTSQHKLGKGIDIKVPYAPGDPKHLKFKEEVLSLANKHGFNGFGFGPSVIHIDTRTDATWWVYGAEDKYDFLSTDVSRLVPWWSEAFEELIRASGAGKYQLRAALASNTRFKKKGIREMNKKDIKQLVAEVLNENSGQGYGKYPYDHESSEDEPAEDYLEEWKALSLNLIRDESRNTAIKIAKVLVKDLELFEDVLDLAGQNQSIGVEILRKLKESEEKA